jgi:hypothetical protein
MRAVEMRDILKPCTFHTVEDLPRHLDGRDDRGQPFVKKDNVLWSNKTI